MGLFKPDIEKLKKNKDIRGLEKALVNKDPVIRRKAMEAIGKIDSRGAIDTLVKYTGIKDDAIKPTLIFTLSLKASDARESDLFDYIKNKAEKSLIDMGPEAVESLIDLYIRGYGDKRAIKEIITAIGKSGIVSIIDSLKRKISYFDSSPDKYDSWYYPNVTHKHNLNQLSSEIITTAGKQAVKSLCNLLQDGDKNVRSWAALMLSKIECEEALDYLIDALSDSDKKVRLSVINALGKIKSEKSAEALIYSFGDEKEWEPGSSIKEAIKKMGKSALAPLVKAIKDDDEKVRLIAAKILPDIEGKEEAIEEMITALGDNNREVRDYMARALGEVKGVNAEKALITAIDDSDIRVRVSVIDSLGRIGSIEARKALMKSLEDNSRFVRYRAALTLGRLGDPVAIDQLMRYLFEIPEAPFSEKLKEVNNILNGLIPKSSLTEDIIYYTLSASTYGDHIIKTGTFSRGRPSPMLEQSDSAVEKLCNTKSPIASNILHLIAEKKDIEVTITSDCANEDWSKTYKLDFNEQRLKAREELKKRGNPPYNPAIYIR